jgi:hypothetical protein
MSKTEFKNEQELAATLVNWLSESHWTVYQEVMVGYGPIIDIVATQGPVVRVIECKMSLTVSLIDQALRHKFYAHYVHVATPRKIKRRPSVALERLLRHEGIGHLEIDRFSMRGESGYYISEVRKARLDRKALTRSITDYLKEEHKSWAAAGNSDNKYYTPWRGTCERWRKYVESHPGCSLKEIISAMGHHYSSDSTAKSCMSTLIIEGKVKGITHRRGDRNKILLYPEGS